MPRPDFPRTFIEFVRRFPNDDACWHYLVQSRWPDGFRCPDGHPGSFITTRKLFQCSDGKQVSVTAGTVMHRTHMPLTTWFWAAYLVATQTPGVSATQLARQLDLNYETAYMMLQKLRAGMVNPLRERLRGPVEVDETLIGGYRPGKVGRGALNKVMVVGAVEVLHNGPTPKHLRSGRVRLRMVSGGSTANLVGFVKENVEPGSQVRTDGLSSYASLDDEGFPHTAIVGQLSKGLPRIHRVFSNLKTWLTGTHHGVSKKHMQTYLNEFAFRFNRRGSPMSAFQTVLGIGTHVEGPTYESLYSGEWRHENPGRKAPTASTR
jgi:transposase-like protein